MMQYAPPQPSGSSLSAMPCHEPQFPYLAPHQVDRIHRWRLQVIPESLQSSVSDSPALYSSLSKPVPTGDVEAVPPLSTTWHYYDDEDSEEDDTPTRPAKLQSLPHPVENPLASEDAPTIAREYSSVVRLCGFFQEERRAAALVWMKTRSPPDSDRLREAHECVLHSLDSAQYVVDYSHELGMKIDFRQLLEWVYLHPATSKFPYPEVPATNPSHYDFRPPGFPLTPPPQQPQPLTRQSSIFV